MTDFFLFAQLNLRNVLISTAKKISNSDFPPPRVFRWRTNREIKSRRLGTIVTSFQDFKLRENRFSDIFLLSYKQRTIVPFLSELISSRYEND